MGTGYDGGAGWLVRRVLPNGWFANQSAEGGDLLQADDGGIAKLPQPDNAATRTWQPMNGNMGTTEVYAIAIDNRICLIALPLPLLC